MDTRDDDSALAINSDSVEKKEDVKEDETSRATKVAKPTEVKCSAEGTVDEKMCFKKPLAAAVAKKPEVKRVARKITKKRCAIDLDEAPYDATDYDLELLASEVRSEVKHIVGCEYEFFDQQVLDSLPIDLSVKCPFKTLSIKDNDYVIELLGQLNFEGDWFKGLTFLITSSTQNPISVTHNKALYYSKVPFVYDRLIQQIKRANGTFTHNVEDIPSTLYRKTVLISNRPCRTPKYLLCLALGINIVSYEWVINCVRSQKLLPYEMLPSGYSVEKRKFIKISERQNLTPLNGIKISVVYYRNYDFENFWSKICRELGAEVIPYAYNKPVNVIVAEDGMQLELSYFNRNAQVVSARWVIECLIRGKISVTFAHRSYNHFL